MSDQKAKQLYQRVGPTLFARAKRSLPTDAAAEAAVKEVVIKLAQLEGLTDAELVKQGRLLLSQHLQGIGRGSMLDSIGPDLGTPRR